MNLSFRLHNLNKRPDSSHVWCAVRGIVSSLIANRVMGVTARNDCRRNNVLTEHCIDEELKTYEFNKTHIE